MSDPVSDADEWQQVTGIVLAGGASRRMGEDKAALVIGGEPLLVRCVRRLRLAAGDVLVVGPARLQGLLPDVMVVPDPEPGLGPLAGVVTGLRAVATTHAFVAACDMPFIRPALVRAMGRVALEHDELDAVLLRTEIGPQPLHAVYARACLPHLEREQEAGERSPRRALAHARILEFGPDEAARYDPARVSAFNANTPEEWRWALALFERITHEAEGPG